MLPVSPRSRCREGDLPPAIAAALTVAVPSWAQPSCSLAREDRSSLEGNSERQQQAWWGWMGGNEVCFWARRRKIRFLCALGIQKSPQTPPPRILPTLVSGAGRRLEVGVQLCGYLLPHPVLLNPGSTPAYAPLPTPNSVVGNMGEHYNWGCNNSFYGLSLPQGKLKAKLPTGFPSCCLGTLHLPSSSRQRISETNLLSAFSLLKTRHVFCLKCVVCEII